MRSFNVARRLLKVSQGMTPRENAATTVSKARLTDMNAGLLAVRKDRGRLLAISAHLSNTLVSKEDMALAACSISGGTLHASLFPFLNTDIVPAFSPGGSLPLIGLTTVGAAPGTSSMISLPINGDIDGSKRAEARMAVPALLRRISISEPTMWRAATSKGLTTSASSPISPKRRRSLLVTDIERPRPFSK